MVAVLYLVKAKIQNEVCAWRSIPKMPGVKLQMISQ